MVSTVTRDPAALAVPEYGGSSVSLDGATGPRVPSQGGPSGAQNKGSSQKKVALGPQKHDILNITFNSYIWACAYHPITLNFGSLSDTSHIMY